MTSVLSFKSYLISHVLDFVLASEEKKKEDKEYVLGIWLTCRKMVSMQSRQVAVAGSC